MNEIDASRNCRAAKPGDAIRKLASELDHEYYDTMRSIRGLKARRNLAKAFAEALDAEVVSLSDSAIAELVGKLDK